MSLLEFWERTYSAVKVKLNSMRETYEKSYGMLDYRDKVVIDIGADQGSTAKFFFSKGARKVIAYEANPILRNELIMHFKDDDRLEVHAAWKGTMPEGDVLKMDCEMCEYMLTEQQLQQFQQWAVGIHGTRLTAKKKEMAEMLKRNGGRVVADMGWEVLFVKNK